MPTISVNVAFRPPRILTLVPPGSLNAVRQAAIANSHVWGGIYNPIVAVSNADEAVEAAQLYLADLVTTVGETPPAYEVARARLDHLFDPPLSRGPFEQLPKGSLPYVDVRLICRHHFQATFRFGAASHAVLPKWDSADPHSTCYAVLFGQYRNEPDEGRYEQHFIRGLAAETVDVALMAELNSYTPIMLTGDELRAFPGSRAYGAVVGSPDDPTTLLTYWNLRAAGCAVVFWPQPEEGPLVAMSEPRLRRELDRRKGSDAPHWTAWLHDPEGAVPPRLAAIAEEAGVSLVRHRISALTHSQPLTRPAIWQSESMTVLANTNDREGTTRLVVPLPGGPFPGAQNDGLGKPSWIVNLSTYSGYELGDNTLDMPWIPELNRWAASTMSYIQNVRTAPRGVSIFADADATSVELQLPNKRQVVRAVFELAGMKPSTSPAGEAAERIVTSLDGLWGCRLLRLHGIRKVLSSGERSWAFDEAVKAVHDEGAFARYRNVSSAADQIRKLVRRGALRPGLHFRCPSCNETIRLRPRDIDDMVSCSRCGESFALGPSVPGAVWKFQPSGFFANLRSHGSIPVVLTMIRFLETLHMASALIVASHFLEGPGRRYEVDCAALWHSRDDRPVMAIAECKGGQQRITDSDVSDLAAVADHVRALGVECYVVLATTRHQLEPEEHALLEAWRDRFCTDYSLDPDYPGQRLGPVVLAADQLDYHWPFGGPASADELPERYVHTFCDLARNCDAIHFDPGYDMSVRRHEDDYLI